MGLCEFMIERSLEVTIKNDMSLLQHLVHLFKETWKLYNIACEEESSKQRCDQLVRAPISR